VKQDISQVRLELDKLLAEHQATSLNFNQQVSDLSLRLERLEQQTFTVDEAVLETGQQTSPSLVTAQSALDPAADTTAEPITQTSENQAEPQTLSLENDHTENTQQAKALSKHVASESVTQLFAPLESLKSLFLNFYRSYQERGLGQVFLITLGGLVTFTLGFAYLLQYSYNYLLSDFGKIALSYGLANAVVATGIVLSIKKPKQLDYGSAIVGLGLVLNYLVTHVSSSYYEMLSTRGGVALLVGITFAGFFLANYFSTRVVAAIALVGGTLSPLLLGGNGLSLQLFLPYLVILAVLSLAFSYRQRWPALLISAAFLHIATIEYLILGKVLHSSFTVLVCTHLLCYLYCFYGLWLINKHKKNKSALSLVSAVIGFFILQLIQLSEHAGYLLTANGFVWLVLSLALWRSAHSNSKAPLALWFRSWQQTPILRQFSLVFSASLFAFAALLLVDQHLQGLIWSLEGSTLLWLGLTQNYRSIRIEAYVLLAIGLASSLITCGIWLVETTLSGDSLSFNIICLSLILNTVMLVLSRIILVKNVPLLSQFELLIKYILSEVIAILEVILLFIVATIVLGEYSVNLAPFASMLLLWHTWKHKLKVTEILAWWLFLPLIATVVISVIQLGHMHFSGQLLVAKIAIVEILAAMWVMSEFYQRFNPNSLGQKAAALMRLVFYTILPWLFIPKVLRNWPEMLPLALCASTAISLATSYWTRHKIIKIESIVLSYLCLGLISIGCINHSGYSLIALLIAGGFYGALLLDNKKKSIQRNTQPKYSAFSHALMQGYYFFALPIAVLANALTGSWQVVAGALAIYFWALLTWKPRPLALRATFIFNFAMAILFTLSCIALHHIALANNGSQLLLATAVDVVVLAFIAWRLTSRSAYVRLALPIATYQYQLWAWHLLLAWAYMIWSYQLPVSAGAPLSSILLVCHGCALMFLSLRPKAESILKLASGFFVVACLKILAVDMDSFSLPQKVVAFMIIGVILLIVAYQYMQMKNKLDEKTKFDNMENK